MTWAQWSAKEDAAYVKKFHEEFQQASPVPNASEYITAKQYDRLYLGDHLNAALRHVTNDRGGMAWGLSYRMSSLNEMFRATRDRRYLKANLQCIRAALAARDDKKGVKLWTGEVAPAWSSGKYSERGRAVFAVHTGMILYPILDFLFLAKENPTFRAQLGDEFDPILKAAEESLAFHDRQWRDGPGRTEGHYIGLNQERVLDNKPLPGNRLSAMGRALWFAYKVTGNVTYHDRALALGRYIKNRLILAPDGAYYWGYWLPTDPVTQSIPKESVNGEDISHGSLTAALPILLATENQVFSKVDMQRLGKMVLNGFARLNNGIFFGSITGNPKSNPSLVQLPARWLRLTPFAPEVYRRLLAFYLNYQPAPRPLDLALLLRYKPRT